MCIVYMLKDFHDSQMYIKCIINGYIKSKYNFSIKKKKKNGC